MSTLNQTPVASARDNQSVLWNASDLTTFAALWAAAKSNGWKISTAALPTFDFNHAVANSPGAQYRPAFTDPLFDA
jgi:hypothetical protein